MIRFDLQSISVRTKHLLRTVFKMFIAEASLRLMTSMLDKLTDRIRSTMNKHRKPFKNNRRRLSRGVGKKAFTDNNESEPVNKS